MTRPTSTGELTAVAETINTHGDDIGCVTGPLVAGPSGASFFFFPAGYGPLLAFDAETNTLAELTPSIWNSYYLVADAEYLYWTRPDPEGPAIMRLRKP